MKTKRPTGFMGLFGLVAALGLASCATDEALFAEYDLLCGSQMCLAPMAEVMYQVEVNSVQWEPAVYFGYDLSSIDPQEALRIDKNIIVLMENPELKINLQAFTDINNTAAYNIALSDRRRLSVEAYLLDKGVGQSRIISSIAGEALPIHSGTSVFDQAVNRRVEMMLLDAAGVPLSFSVTLPDGEQTEFVPPYPDRKLRD